MGASPARRRSPPIDEPAFHAWLADHLPAGRTGRLPLGDDAADLTPRRGSVGIATTDTLVEGTHFLARSPPGAIGAAATNVSLSDLASKGAEPAGILLAIVLPPGTPAKWPQRLVAGAEAAAAREGAHVIGGDTKPGPVRTVVSTAIGWARPDRLPPRSGARPGDVLVVTGTVGRGGGAAEELRRRGPVPDVLARLLEVHPRVAAGRVLAAYAHAMLDTSDGVADAAQLLAAASRVRVVVDEPSLPLASGVRKLPEGRRRAAAFFGGDYELLAALAPGDLAAARRGVVATGTPLAAVGRVERGRGAVLATAAGQVSMPEGGWRPFRTSGRRRN
jgi:thiamine-monophosphate kinase